VFLAKCGKGAAFCSHPFHTLHVVCGSSYQDAIPCDNLSPVFYGDWRPTLDSFVTRCLAKPSSRWTALPVRSLHNSAVAMATSPARKRPLSPSSRPLSPPAVKRKLDSTTTSEPPFGIFRAHWLTEDRQSRLELLQTCVTERARNTSVEGCEQEPDSWKICHIP
jgi:hypothetical protein